MVLFFRTRTEPIFNPYQPRIFVLAWKTSGFHEKHRVYVHTLRILREMFPKVYICVRMAVMQAKSDLQYLTKYVFAVHVAG